MNNYKIMFAVCNIFTCEFKKKDNNSDYLINIKDNDLLTFKRKKDANKYIGLAHALRSVKVVKTNNIIDNKNTYYNIY